MHHNSGVFGKPRRTRPRQLTAKEAKYTPNGLMIADLMRSQKMKGNPKDYVIIVGYRLLDYWGSYDIKYDEKSAGYEGVALIHKKKLHMLLGGEVASCFWNRKLGIRVSKSESGNDESKSD